MKKLTLITVMVVLLAIINACLLIFLWVGRPQREGRPTGGNARDYLVKELHLTEAQNQQYDSLRK